MAYRGTGFLLVPAGFFEKHRNRCLVKTAADFAANDEFVPAIAGNVNRAQLETRALAASESDDDEFGVAVALEFYPVPSAFRARAISRIATLGNQSFEVFPIAKIEKWAPGVLEMIEAAHESSTPNYLGE